MSRILVTGATGFLGGALAETLYYEGDDYVVAMGRDDNARRRPLAHHWVWGDVRDYDFVRRVLADYEIDTVYHMAAQAIVRVCSNDPVTAYDINVMGTVRLLEACRSLREQVKNIVVSVSDKAYGHVAPPYDESTPFDPRYIYEASKACQDIAARSYAYNYGLPVKVARSSNVYGPGDPNMSRLIPNTIVRCLLGKSPILHRGVMGYVREFVYISDVVEAFRLIAREGIPGEAYCIGGTECYSVLDLVDRIIQKIDVRLVAEVQEKSAVFKEIEKQWMDASRLKGLGWQPKVSLDEGLQLAIDYYREEL